MTAPHPLPEEAGPLFREAPESFIASRDELVGRLKETGRPDDAAAVKSMRKPTVVTWTLNQLAARDPDGVTALLDAGSDVRAVQRAALSSTTGAAERLKDASARRRTAITSLTTTARDVLEDAGRASPQHLDAVRGALETASTDTVAGDHLRAGTFERPPEVPTGFGDLAGLTLVPEPGPARTVTARKDEQRPAVKRRRSSATAEPNDQAREAERKRLRRDRDAAVREARKARGAAERFAQELEAMRRRMAVVEGKHRAAETSASARESEAERAEAAFAATGDD
jgi:hypothetical protein